ncbi:DUF4123 domain-containing protein [Vibrio europaeus]|uniref:DUF4123 domain-containing protein n=1 Tax=Vibrio europaeus TaxID=300876 RepID=A0A178JGV2_9VIBR|nr:DUF4123 domain-containing protein [Vibrio europaeus]MDC5704577.1 DUF4123 domain-containing protein [Vibrio europaeus]MDC5712071.1 DUF4123 domain-containing protein [Vibrio europaeus]MDC5717799.1 DUF4123 domain-containing protein [Vibrio europaeus]MDC5727700.1 DUF4123 domain-containing protein [Vibrio europaeus]MDC5731909.1 DUF4123 domain-containing protein [Vibrio europaeus]
MSLEYVEPKNNQSKESDYLTLQSWLQDNEKHSYWLVDHKLHKSAVNQNDGFGFDESVPLFQGAMFKDVMSLTPWLIPVSDSVISLPEALLNQGLAFSSSASVEEVLSHLRSLLVAAMDGEEVLFRFYDRAVILPMLSNMDDSEVNQFLGKIHQLVGLESRKDSLTTYTNQLQSEVHSHQGCWWIMKPHHFDPQENLKLVQSNLESWLWQHFSKKMNQLINQGRDIDSVIISTLSEPDKTLTYRVMSAALAIIAGKEQLVLPSATELLKEHENDEAQYALYVLTQQFGSEV